jgi:hypothetical protein
MTILANANAMQAAYEREIQACASLIEEAGISPREADSLRDRVARLIANANEGRAKLKAAEEQLAALRAPVDVEGECARRAKIIAPAIGLFSPVDLRTLADALQLYAEKEARLAREAKGLRAEVARITADYGAAQEAVLMAMTQGDQDARREETRAVTAEKERDTARAEIAQLKAEVTAAWERGVVDGVEKDAARLEQMRTAAWEQGVRYGKEKIGEEVERLKSIATVSPTPEEVSSCAVLAEVAGKPAREAVLYLAAIVSTLRASEREEQRRRAREHDDLIDSTT